MRTVVKHSPLIIDGKTIGQATEIYTEQGEPIFGLCVANECPRPAINETLIGLHFCDDHFLKWYSTDDFPIDRSREFNSDTQE